MAAKEHVASACAVLCKFLFDKDLSLASAAAKALGHAGLRAPLPLPLASGEESKETDVSALAALTPSQKVVVYRILELMKERDMKVSRGGGAGLQ